MPLLIFDIFLSIFSAYFWHIFGIFWHIFGIFLAYLVASKFTLNREANRQQYYNIHIKGILARRTGMCRQRGRGSVASGRGHGSQRREGGGEAAVVLTKEFNCLITELIPQTGQDYCLLDWSLWALARIGRSVVKTYV